MCNYIGHRSQCVLDLNITYLSVATVDEPKRDIWHSGTVLNFNIRFISELG